MANIKHLIKTLNDLHNNRESNLQSLAQTKSAMTKQIREVKSRLLQQIDDVERDLHVELSSLNRKHEIEIIKQKEEIVLVSLNSNKNEIEFLKDHGSDNQLFRSLHEEVTNIKSSEASVLQLISNSHEVVITFDETKDVKLGFIGTLSESVSSCQVQYKSKKLQQAQIMAQPIKHIAGFEMDAKLQLKTGHHHNLIDICVTDDNKLLLTNYLSSHQHIYVYRDYKNNETEFTFSSSPRCVAVITVTDKAVVTLPHEKSVHFINAKDMTKGDKVNVGFRCYGITAIHDKIYVGGESGTIKTLGTNGKIIKSIKQGTCTIYFMSFDDSHEQFFVRCLDKLLCINLDGTLVYSKDVSGTAGIIRDRQGNIYYGGYNDSNIKRTSSDGQNCEEMLNKDDDINRPFGMCFNNDFTKLYLINYNRTSLNVYKCK